MSNDVISHWVEKAKLADGGALPAGGVKVIRNTHKSQGSSIIDIAEKLRPWLAKMFEGVRDENGMLVQPARIRGIALNLAHHIIKEQKH